MVIGQMAAAGGSMWVLPWSCQSRANSSAHHAESMPNTAPMIVATMALPPTIGRKVSAPSPAMIVMWWVTGKLRPRLRNSSDIAERLKNTRFATEAITGKNSASLMLRPADSRPANRPRTVLGTNFSCQRTHAASSRGAKRPHPAPSGRFPKMLVRPNASRATNAERMTVSATLSVCVPNHGILETPNCTT